MTSKVQALLKAIILLSALATWHCTAQQVAKEHYQWRVEDHLANNYSRQVWQELKHLTNYKDITGAVCVSANASIAEEVNLFYTHFEVKSPRTTLPIPITRQAETKYSRSPPPQEQGVIPAFKSVNIKKAVAPKSFYGYLQALSDICHRSSCHNNPSQISIR